MLFKELFLCKRSRLASESSGHLEYTGFPSLSFAGELAYSPWLYISFRATFNYSGFTCEPSL